MTKDRKKLFLGVDGGSSKTAFLLCDETGHILARHRGPGANIEPPNTEASIRTLSHEIQTTCYLAGLQVSDIDHFGLCLCGLDFPWEHDPHMEALSSQTGFSPEQATLVNDGHGALWGASPEPVLVMLQLGSGYCCGWRNGFGTEGKFDRSDMLHLFDIRQELVSLLARVLDGFYEDSPLVDTALKHLGVTRENLAEVFLRSGIPSGKVRLTPPLIFKAWARGDVNARRLVDRAMEDYMLTIRTMIRKINNPACTISLGGGVINQAPEAFWTVFEQKISNQFPEARLVKPQMPPECGAAVMAAFQAGLEPANFYKQLKENFVTHER